MQCIGGIEFYTYAENYLAKKGFLKQEVCVFYTNNYSS